MCAAGSFKIALLLSLTLTVDWYANFVIFTAVDPELPDPHGFWCLSPSPFAAMSDDEPTFESTDSGASHTYPQQAGEVRKGSHLMIKGHPCKCIEVSTSKTGKHGHAKAHIVAVDIFTGKKLEDLCPTSHNLEVPFVKRTELQLLTADGDSGEVSLLLEDGTTKDDLNLPTFVSIGEPTDEDKKVTEEILKLQDDGKDFQVIILSACGIEKIIATKVSA